jgi:excisionase family DNA binding protein
MTENYNSNENMNEKRKPLTKKELAEFFSVRPRTIENWMKAGRVPFWKIGKTVRFDLDAVKARLG